jgi:erythromycin esterase-like protein
LTGSGCRQNRADPGKSNRVRAMNERELIQAVREHAQPLTGIGANYDYLIGLIGDARCVLLGEASHGTHEFYEERAHITQRLIAEKGFNAIAAEADWPDAYRVNRYVRGATGDAFAIEALADLKRFPQWMWRNTAVAEFVEWLRQHNEKRPQDAAVGFYGMDLYSLHASMAEVLRFLEKVDPEAAKQARERYSCFDHFGEDTQVYGFLAGSGAMKSCEEQVVQQLMALQQRVGQDDEGFYALQNARLVKNAEQYYRSMFIRDAEPSWNLRDRHMMQTLEALEAHLERRGAEAKIVVWAHNSHLGDARATEMGWRRGEIKVGQLARNRYGKRAFLVGFTTHHGTVTAASDWGAPAQRKNVRPALPESYERLFHDTGLGRFVLDLRAHNRTTEGLRDSRLERAIGVIYRPGTERMSHYFKATLPEQFDAVLHFDETRAVEPFERSAEWEKGELPETYPYAV